MNYLSMVAFHGHECPGLTIGYRMACTAMRALNADRSSDEELVAIVENNACGVDALQCVSGCTFGKGNLIFRDYGKQVYTLYSRGSKMAVRVVFHGKGIPEQLRDDRSVRARFILGAPEDDLLAWAEAVIDEPEAAGIAKPTACAICGEYVMETRLCQMDGSLICIPCAEKHSK